MSRPPVVATLVAKWEEDASALERYADAHGAAVCRLHVAELGEAIRAALDDELTIAESAQVTGYSEDHLRHEVAEGKIPNAGRKGAPRIRRGDLPTKSGKRIRGVDPEAAALAIMDGGR